MEGLLTLAIKMRCQPFSSDKGSRHTKPVFNGDQDSKVIELLSLHGPNMLDHAMFLTL